MKLKTSQGEDCNAILRTVKFMFTARDFIRGAANI